MDNTILKKIVDIAQREKVQLYMVGGCLRSLIPGKRYGNENKEKILDIDLIVEGGGVGSFAEKASGELEGTFVNLDKEEGVFRIVVKVKKVEALSEETLCIDLTGLRGKSIVEDLAERDFTLNSFALDLRDYLHSTRWREKIIDPFKGLTDLQEGIIRTVSTDVFSKDPLRLLRAVRLCAQLNFTLEEGTRKGIISHRSLIKNSSGERIRDELWRILETDNSYQGIILMEEELGLLTELFPEVKEMRDTQQNYYHGEDVWNHCMRTYQDLEDYINKPPFTSEITSKLKDQLEEDIVPRRTRKQLLKFFALFHDVGKTKTKKTLDTGRIVFHRHESEGVSYIANYGGFLKLSSAEIRALNKFMKLHLRPLMLHVGKNVGPKAFYRFFKKSGKESVEILLHSMADFTAKREARGRTEEVKVYEEFIQDTFNKYYFKKDIFVSPPALVNGNDIIKALKIKPSPGVGYLLEKISEAQVEGKVRDRKEALSLAAKLAQDKVFKKRTRQK